MKLFSCGAADGQLVVYFHGVPGAPAECALFDLQGQVDGLSFVCLDRFSADSSLRGEAYYRALAAEILACAGTAQVHLVGFSIGAFVALQVCRHLPDQVASLNLISAAAPLEAGDFLQGMAGRQVFSLARRWPMLFRLLSRWQAVLAKFAPKLLFNLLFASAQGADRELSADPEFQAQSMAQLRSCFAGRLAGYVREVCSYVLPWAASLAAVTVNTRIWQGAEDNWSPQGMAEYLRAALAGGEPVVLMPGLSHYSCLQQAVPLVCAAIRQGA
ncbi:alpha/beta fold hydrolase [Pseudomonas sp. N040]|uniref:alpha/beta fold hydrolase n=1 Tax=Pseudomonas sp. N040 TaxID=2785325 RepID=UPI001C614232|nr:alpha/beta hydrolase [Pseudomonas sp. N040]MBW7014985.1 alpha/beta hydrolase [Pseudomonas sp. N040]